LNDVILAIECKDDLAVVTVGSALLVANRVPLLPAQAHALKALSACQAALSNLLAADLVNPKASLCLAVLLDAFVYLPWLATDHASTLPHLDYFYGYLLAHR